MQNMNLALNSPDTMDWRGRSWVPPVNWKDIPTRLLTTNQKKTLNGQLLDQFENEAFKFVLEKNLSDVNTDDHLIIKPHMLLDLGLNDTNCRTLDLNKIYKHFDNHQWVSLGFFFGGGNVEYEDRAYTLSQASLYGRNHKHKIIDLDNKYEYPDYDYLSAVTYVHFRKLKDSNFVICTLNPHLVSVPHLDEGIVGGNHRFLTLDTYDSTIEEYLINPSIVGATVVDNHIFAKGDEPFTIKIGEESLLWLKFEELADFPVKVETNLDYSKKDNHYTFNTNAPIGYIKLHIHTDSMSDKYNDKGNSGITTLEYIVVGDQNGK